MKCNCVAWAFQTQLITRSCTLPSVSYRALYLSGNALNGTLPSLALGALRYVGFLLLGTVLIDIDEQLYRTDCVICSVLNLANNSLSGTLPSGLSLLS